MASYLIQAAYTPEAWATLIRNPHDRTAAIKSAVEGIGGTLVHAWGCFGEYDVIVVVDVPDNLTAAALAISFAAGGALKSCKTTPLLSTSDVENAVRKAGTVGYKPPSA